MNTLLKLVILLFMLEYSSADTETDFHLVGNYDNCVGKYIANYTLISQFSQNCEQITAAGSDTILMSSDSSGQESVNTLKELSVSIYPAGDYVQLEILRIIVSGPLQGRYLYLKNIGFSIKYLRKCSPVLDYSHLTTDNSAILIADQSDFNALIASSLRFDEMQKSASTICQGRSSIF